MGSFDRLSRSSAIAAAAIAAFGLFTAAGTTATAAASTLDAPAVSATPATGLSHGDTVSVSVSGFTADSSVLLGECVAVPSGVACARDNGAILTIDGSGGASTSISVLRTFEAFTSDGQSIGVVDCDTVAGGCSLNVAGQGLVETASASLSFA
ncbi:enediyne antibiotic chromoprotein [Actinosynnema sp. NPDC047251]|uniref:Putative apoprotein n=1 Tax=Saccharothrix espanaensis (strain ATCC 51144 / DSM 44229 / JCM 9112 / NBRC 15066 / NRRL 15764) TaxID=1179773 RepID=K0K304_SACES|nr:enediyne antibiotic chromoprotein [Saccharothrix espanaensis]CCH32681.1 putative apoprotein [Saccharothrix espanaensis DSM 44229]